VGEGLDGGHTNIEAVMALHMVRYGPGGAKPARPIKNNVSGNSAAIF